MTKLIVSIPAFNEQKTIKKVIGSIPKQIKGIDQIEILVWDDGSTDNTAAAAKQAGADYIFSNKANLGLAKTFHNIIAKAIELEADVLVNTDADNQYDQSQITELIAPIINGDADLVNGNRQVAALTHMPAAKKYGNIIGSWVIRLLTGCELMDASSGFRAYSKRCLGNFYLTSDHTYTHETIIQAVNNDMVISEVPVAFSKREGESRLISGVIDHIKKSASTIVRTILKYKAFKVFVSAGVVMMLIGGLGGVRFLYFFLQGNGTGHIQSLILSSILINLGFTTIAMGVLADLISINRKMIRCK